MENSMILKRFLFEFLAYYSDMIYIAFIKFDIMTLKEYLISLYMVDEVRRLVTESLIPSIGRI